MIGEEINQDGTKLARRLILAPGEHMPWHVDPFRRFSVVVRGSELAIEYRDGHAWVQRQLGERVAPSKVTLGAVGIELVEVTAGLNAGDTIVVQAQ